MRYVVYLFIGTHLAACGWFLLACSSLEVGPYDPNACDATSWAVQSTTKIYDASFRDRYLVSLYWAVATTTTVGFGDIRAHANLEKVYACIIMIIGVVSYAYVITTAASSFIDKGYPKRKFRQRMVAVLSFLKKFEVKKELQKRTLRHFEGIWKTSRGVKLDALFTAMPPALRADLSLSIYKSAIDMIPLFYNTDLSFSRLLAMYFKPITFYKGEYIVRKGDQGKQLYFVINGSAEAINEDESIIYATLEVGQFFGEISLVYQCPYRMSIRAATNCELFVLTKEDLDLVMTSYPDILKKITMMAKDRLEVIKKLNSRPTKEAEISTIRKTPHRRLPSIVFCTIPNDGVFGILLYWLGFLLSYISFFLTSYQGVFQEGGKILLIVNYSIEIYFLFEILLKFHLTYEDKHGNMVKSLKDIACHYLSTWFVLDVLAIIPYELFVFGLNEDNTMSLFYYVRLFHLIRILRIYIVFKNEQKNLKRSFVVVQLLKFFVLFSILSQSVACIWYALACKMDICLPHSWATKVGINPQEDTYHIHYYISSLYWAVITLTTVGYGDLVPVNSRETVFSIFIMVLGRFMLALILGLCASALINSNMEKRIFKDKFRAFKKYLDSLSISAHTRKRVLNMCEYLWLRDRGHPTKDILSDLPFSLKADITMNIAGNFLRKEPLFHSLKREFLRQVSETLQFQVYLPGEVIVFRGNKTNGVLFLYKGEVEMVDDEHKMKLWDEGDSFGMFSMLYDLPSTLTLTACSHADVLVLTKDNFLEVCKNNVDVFNNIAIQAKKQFGLPITLTVPSCT